MLMHLIGWAIFGLVAGAIARLLHPGRDPMNWVWTMALGIAGALVGGYLGDLLGLDAQGGFLGFLAAIAGSIILLAIYHAVTARRAAVGGPTAGGPATSDDYKRAVFDDLSRGPNG
ncbi:MAG TPA: GlsB/YeaQ/YmgE family stress response membrane protein [Isosphaeraceae bacterium]|jgi:uncharacterized membrane protein YeaQ/YmgE (transglycosylase-associated protein family)